MGGTPGASANAEPALGLGNMAKPREKGKIPHQDWPAIRTRYGAGETLASIARDYGCTGPAIRYIVNRPAGADAPVAGTARRASRSLDGRPAERRQAAHEETAPARAEEAPIPADARPGAAPSASAIDPDLRRRVSSEIASFLAVFDSFLTENSPESCDELLDATDRLMRVAARTRIELERARTTGYSRLHQGHPATRSRAVAS